LGNEQGIKCHPHGICGYGNKESRVMLIGIAPGNNEMLQKRPFVGQSGKLLDSVLRAIHWPRENTYATNLVCWKNDSPSPAEIKECFPRVLQEIAEIKPKLIVTLGKLASETFGNGRVLSEIRGVVRWDSNLSCYILATYHPSAVLHGGSFFIHDIVRDLAKIPRIMNELPEDGTNYGDVTYTVARTQQEAQDFLDSFEPGEPVAVDIETSNKATDEIDVFVDELLCLAVSNGVRTSVFPAPCAQGLAWPKLHYIFHNGMFDTQGLIKYLGVDLPICEDTMLMSYSLDERSGVHKLKTLSREYVGAGFYEEETKKYRAGKFDLLDKNKLYEYNAKDAAYTTRLYNVLKPMQEYDNVRNIYETLLIPVANTFKYIQLRGVRIDQERLKELALEWLPKYLESEDHLAGEANKYGFVGRINPRSPKQLSKFLYNILLLPGGPSVDKESLAALKGMHPFIEELAAFRGLEHLVSHYVMGLQPDIKKDGRVHSSVLIHGTVCVSGDSYIWTTDGLLRADEIVPKTVVGPIETEIGLYTQYDTKDSSHVWRTPDRKTVKVELRNGLELCCTPEHKLLTATGWKSAETLQKGDLVACCVGRNGWGKSLALPAPGNYALHTNAKDVCIPKLLNKNISRLIGYFVANGSVHQGNGTISVRINTHIPEVAEDVMGIVENEFGLSGNYYADNVTITSKSLGMWFCNLVEFTRGDGAIDKHIPKIIRSAPKELVVEFLNGLILDAGIGFRDDGWGRKPYISFNTISQRLATEVHQVWMNLGILPVIDRYRHYSDNNHTTKRSPSKYMYRVSLEAHKALLAASVLSPVSYEDIRLIERFKTWNPTRTIAESSFIRVKRVLDGNTQDVYDFTVPDTHSFIANGVVVHNTGRLSYTNPPLQTIPKPEVVGEDYARIREIFAPEPGYVIAEADYEKAEVWGAYAHSGDEVLHADLLSGDFHRKVAATIFRKAEEDVTSLERKRSKYVTFGMLNNAEVKPAQLLEA